MKAVVDRFSMAADQMRLRFSRMSAQEIARQPPHRPPGMFEIVGGAIQSEWVGSFALRAMSRSGYEVDPDFRAYDPPTWKRLTEGLPPELVDGAFDDVVSLDHAIKVRQQLLELAHVRRRLAEAGWTGLSARLGAAILDPVAIAAAAGATALAGPLGGIAIYGTRVTRAQRFIRAGLVAGGSEAAVQSYLSLEDPEQGFNDIVLAGLGGLVLGGGSAVWLGSKLDRAAQSWQRAIELSEVMKAGIELSDKGKLYFREGLSDEARKRAAAKLVASMDDIDDETREALSNLTPQEQLGWANARGGDQAVPEGATVQERATFGLGAAADNPPRIDDFSLAGVTTPARDTGLISRLRFSMSGLLARSRTDEVRLLARMLAENPLPGRSGDVAIQSLSEWAAFQGRKYMTRYYRIAMRELAAWRKAHNKGHLSGYADRDSFFEEVGRAIRHDPGAYTSDPHINAVANLQRDLHAELLMLARRSGVKGFSDVPMNVSYLMRVHSLAKIAKAIDDFGEPEVLRLLSNAIARGSENLTSAQADKIARGYLNNVQNLDRNTFVEKARMFSIDQSELLQRTLREELGDRITDAEIEDIIYAVKARPDDAGTPPRAKRRLALDETDGSAIQALNRSTGQLQTLRISDILENNAEVLMTVYARQMVGHAGMAEVFRRFPSHRGVPAAGAADDVITSFDGIIDRLRAAGATDAEIRKLDVFRKSILGMRITGRDYKVLRELSRMVRNLNFMRVMNQVGFAQVAETGMIIAEAGWKAQLKQMPILGRIFKRAADGEMSDQFLREIEEIWALGTDRLRNQVINRLDAHEGMLELGGGKLDRRIRTGQRFVADISGMAPIMMAQQRWAVAAAVQKWADIAVGGKLPSKMRLASMGLSESDARRIAAMLKANATMEDGLLGRKVRAVNLDSWSDMEAASKFVIAIDKWSRRVIQQNDIGNLTLWMTSDIGKVMVQFRSFMMVAWEKYLLYGARMADWQAFSGFAHTMLLGGLAYAAQQYANSIGLPEKQRKAFLAERLSPQRIAMGAFYRSGHSSLIPTIVDTGAGAVDLPQPFQFTRSTQLSTDIITGNPTKSFADDLFGRAPKSIAHLVRPDKDFTRGDLKALARLMPLQNMLGIKNMIDLMASRLPERQEDED